MYIKSYLLTPTHTVLYEHRVYQSYLLFSFLLGSTLRYRANYFMWRRFIESQTQVIYDNADQPRDVLYV